MIFEKQRIGVAPLASTRDLVIYGSIMVGMFGTAAIVTHFIRLDPGLVRATMIGAIFGTLPSVFACLPVHGRIPALAKPAFDQHIGKKRFRFVTARDGAAVYEYTCARWARWDSNRVVVRRRNDGDWAATVPLHLYRSLRR